MRIESEQVEAVFRKLEEWGQILPEDWLEDLVAEFDTPEQSGQLLSDAREWLKDHIAEGATCPCCDQYAKIYRFPLNGAMARGLIAMYRTGALDWVNVPDLGLPGGHLLKLRFWGIIEKPPELRRNDGSTRVGIWRVTQQGEDWIRHRVTVLSHARIFDNRCLGLVGDPITIRDALGTKFHYDELMRGS